MPSNGYELGTARTLDSAVDKLYDLSGHLPDGEFTIRKIWDYKAGGELILVIDTGNLDFEYYRSVNGGRSWTQFYSHGSAPPGGWFVTSAGSLLFERGSDTYRYTGGGETPTQVAPISPFNDGYTQTTDGDIYIAEYDTGGDGNHTDIYKSTDDGENFSQAVNVKNATGEDMRHLHGIASQGSDRLFVTTGDTNHALLETDDEFSTYNRYIWNTGPADPPNEASSYLGMSHANNALILGCDHIPPKITYIWTGDAYGDIQTSPELGGGTVPRAMFHVMIPPRLGAERVSTTTRFKYNGINAFIHRIDTDGMMLYGSTVNNNILAVSTTGGRTWKFIETPVGGDPAIMEDAIYLAGDVGGQPTLYRIPKTTLWNYPEPDTQVYHLLRQEEVGLSSSGSNGVYFGRDVPFHLFTDFRIGVETDGVGLFRLMEDKHHGTAIANKDGQNNVVDADLTSGFTEITLNDRPNYGFSVEIFEQESSTTLTADCFIQAHR